MYRYEGQAWSGRMATDWTEAVPSSPGTVGAVSLHLGRRWSQCDWSIVRGLRGRLHGRHNKTGTTSRCHAGPNDVRVSPCCDATRVMRRCLLLLALGDRGRGAESGRRGGRAGWPHREEGMRQRCSLEGPAEDVGRNNPLPGQGGTGAGRWFIPNGPEAPFPASCGLCSSCWLARRGDPAESGRRFSKKEALLRPRCREAWKPRSQEPRIVAVDPRGSIHPREEAWGHGDRHMWLDCRGRPETLQVQTTFDPGALTYSSSRLARPLGYGRFSRLWQPHSVERETKREREGYGIPWASYGILPGAALVTPPPPAAPTATPARERIPARPRGRLANLISHRTERLSSVPGAGYTSVSRVGELQRSNRAMRGNEASGTSKPTCNDWSGSLGG